jgi:acetylornithine deacetylase/succinyl-diaminopimelate desuccinylase-like protein
MERGKPDSADIDRMESTVRTFLPEVVTDLKELIKIPSVAFPGYPAEPVYRMAHATADFLKRYGLSNVLP